MRDPGVRRLVEGHSAHYHWTNDGQPCACLTSSGARFAVTFTSRLKCDRRIEMSLMSQRTSLQGVKVLLFNRYVLENESNYEILAKKTSKFHTTQLV